MPLAAVQHERVTVNSSSASSSSRTTGASSGRGSTSSKSCFHCPWSPSKWTAGQACKEASTTPRSELTFSKKHSKPSQGLAELTNKTADLALAGTVPELAPKWAPTTFAALGSVDFNGAGLSLVGAVPEVVPCVVEGNPLAPSISPITFIHIYHLISSVGK